MQVQAAVEHALEEAGQVGETQVCVLCVCVHVCACVHDCVHVYLCMCAYVPACARMCVCACVTTHVRLQGCMHVCECACTGMGMQAGSKQCTLPGPWCSVF